MPGIPHKSELGVPFRFQMAMTDSVVPAVHRGPEGPQWICRRTVIWAKSLVKLETQAGRRHGHARADQGPAVAKL